MGNFFFFPKLARCASSRGQRKQLRMIGVFFAIIVCLPDLSLLCPRGMKGEGVCLTVVWVVFLMCVSDRPGAQQNHLNTCCKYNSGS